MQTIPCLNLTFDSALAGLKYALKEANMAAASAGFKNLDKAHQSISANRTTVYIYFDFEAAHFPISLKFIYKDGSLRFESFDTCTEFGLEAITDMEIARNQWNGLTND